MTYAKSGKNIGISRSALFTLSEPCITFSSRIKPKSPRIVPGEASAGFVAPINFLAIETADGPDQTVATTGPE